MQPIDFTATLDGDGRLPPARAAFLRRQLQLAAGREVRVRVTDPARTSAQNRYYWGFIVRPVSQGLIAAGVSFERIEPGGDVLPLIPTDEYVHAYFKARYLGVVTVAVGEMETLLPRSSADLTADEFADYCEACRTDPVVERFGIYLPEPGEAGFDQPFKSGRILEPT